MIVRYTDHINPNEPAVIPTVTKKPNSIRSLEPGGIEVSNSDRGIIPLECEICF